MRIGLDNQRVLFQITSYVLSAGTARAFENFSPFGELGNFLSLPCFWNLNFPGKILPTMDQVYFCLRLKYEDTVTAHSNKLF